MISTGVHELPDNMIMQRWTKHARHILPADLSQYRRDNPALLAQTYRHSSLMLRALQFVNMGDSNAQSHTMAMKVLDDGIEALVEVCKDKDGLGLGHTAILVEESIGNAKEYDKFPNRAPKRKNEKGRPTNKRQKAGHEKLSRRPRFCSICRSDKHTMQNCPSRDPSTKKARKPPTCGGCGITGHSIDQCVRNQHQEAAKGYVFL